MVIPAISRLGLGFGAELSGKEFQAYCISLANEIDAATGNDEVPANVQELALILNHVCRLPCFDHQTKAVVMMLMISAKSACQLGWFPQKETQELLAIIDSMWNGFSSPENVTPSVNSPVSVLQQVIERFYPFVKLGHIIVSLEAKPESKILVKDFHISKKMPDIRQQRVGLIVVRTDDMSKSSCIVHPQEVSFLLNGKSVDKRVNSSMEPGPQLPTDVTALLNPGANILQAIGCFGGNYFIAIALMNVEPLPDKPLLKDYVHSEVTESDSDYDIIEGPSKISLSCPISCTRIKLPVKGHVCKHLQCFDFWNYVNMNKRRPSWRCPHCNQSVCYTDICVDQKMKKILEEVGPNAADVVISADGSWTIGTENNEDVEPVPETTHDQGDPNICINLGSTVLDHARDENGMETFNGTQGVDGQSYRLSEIQGPSNNIHEPATDYTLLNQSSASINTLPQLPQSLAASDGGQFMNLPQLVNTRYSAASQALPMTFLPTSFQQDTLATNAANIRTSMPAAQPSQFQGSHVTSLGQCLGRTPDLMERWNHIYGRCINQTQVPPTPLLQQHYAMQNQSPSNAQQRPMPSFIAHPQTLPVNYGGNVHQSHMQRPMSSSISQMQSLHVNCGGNGHQSHMQRPMSSSISQMQSLHVNCGGNTHQRPTPSTNAYQTLPENYGGSVGQRRMQSPTINLRTLPVNHGGTTDQRLNPGSTRGQFSSQEFMNLTPANTANWRPQSRMRGCLAPGSLYDHMIIRPTQPVQAQAQTLPPPQASGYYNVADEVQAFLMNPSNPASNNETQAGSGSLPVAEGAGFPGSYWSMPPETW